MPLFGALFDLCVDPLLRKLLLRIPRPVEALVGYLDDIALAVAGFFQQFGRIMGEFEAFQRGAGPSLNALKCVIVPLWTSNLADAVARIRRREPRAAGFAIEGVAKFLGVYLGPLAAGRSFEGCPRPALCLQSRETPRP